MERDNNMRNIFLAIAIAALIAASGCVERAAAGRGPDFSVSADPARIFSGDETIIYVDIENNGEKKISKVFADVFDTGVLEDKGESGTGTGGAGTGSAIVISEGECIIAALDTDKKNPQLYGCVDTSTDKTTEKNSCQPGTGISESDGALVNGDYTGDSLWCDRTKGLKCCIPYGKDGITANVVSAISAAAVYSQPAYSAITSILCAELTDECKLCGYYWSSKDYNYELRCRYHLEIKLEKETRQQIVPVDIIYADSSSGEKSFWVEAFPNLEWKDIRVRASLRYDAENEKMFLAGDTIWVKNGDRIRFRYPNGQVKEYKVGLGMRSGDPTGRVVLVDPQTGKAVLGFTPTGGLMNGKPVVAIEPEPDRISYDGSRLQMPFTKGYVTIESIKDPRTGAETMVTTIVDTGKPVSFAAGDISEIEPGTGAKKCYSNGECNLKELGYCGLCESNICVPAMGKKILGQACSYSCQCAGGVCDGVCKEPKYWTLCKAEKSAISYYYCTYEKCPSGETVQEKIPKPECESLLLEHAKGAGALRSIRCEKTSDCYTLGSYQCPVCWNSVCVQSDSPKAEGMSCERNCQCQDGKCVLGNCKKSAPVKNKCSDGTAAGECSKKKPYFCDAFAYAWEQCGKCGCPDGKECLSDGSCGSLNECTFFRTELLPNARETLACRLKAPVASRLLKPETRSDVSIRLRYSDALNSVIVFDTISPEEYRRLEMTGSAYKQPRTYSFSNRDVQLDVEFSEDLPVVARDKDVYVHFTIKDTGSGMIYPIRLYEDFAIDQMPEVIDTESCSLNRVIVPEGKIFPRITCKLKINRNIIYLSSHIVNINVKYAYEMRKSVSVSIIK